MHAAQRIPAGALLDESMGLHRPSGAVRQLHAEAVTGGLEHSGPDGYLDRDPGGERRHRRPDPGGRPRARTRRLPRHDRARRCARRLALAVRAGRGGRHPRARDADLARREVVGLHAGDRAALRQLEPAQRAGPVRLLRTRRRLPRDGQRGRRQALRHERPLLAAAPRVRDPAAGRRRLDRRGRPRPVVSRSRARVAPRTTSRTGTRRS